MKKILALVALTLSFSAFSFEEKVSFTHFGNEGWGQAYYSCDYAEAQTEKHLETLGATNIDVSCNGGIDYTGVWPVSVKASFDLPILQTGNGWGVEVTIKGDRRNPSCGLNVAIMKAILPKFSNVKVVSKQTTCGSANSNYKYVLFIEK